jgi:mannose/cellobiose epimerase-like protein (N-acyl-D-glucosamine 2-epimerase family)
MKHALLIGATISMLTSPVWACDAPATPDTPNGATATLEEMIAAQQAVKAFQTANNAYRDCLDAVMAANEAGATDGDEAATEARNGAVEAYNTAVSAEERLASEFNADIRAFREANPSN